MRKVLSFVLVLSLVLGSFGMAFAAPLSDMAGQKSAEAVSVLTELGVVKGYPDGTYKPGNIVTRAEMAVIVVSALGLADYATGTSSFSDMGGHWSNGYVAYATSLGVIAGYPDGTFKPDKTVSYDEAATMLVAALGYNADSLVGTWPANFVTKAKTLGILDGIKAGVAGANRGDIAIMVYQTLDQQIGKTNKDGDFVASAGDTMLARLDAELYDPDKGAAPSTTDPGDAFVLDDTADVADGVNVRAFYGAYVTAYANSDNEIIAVKEVKSTFLTGEFAAAVVAGANILADADFEAEKDYALKSAIDTDDIVSLVNGENNGTGKAVAAKTEYKVAAKVSGVKITEIYSISDWDLTKGDDFMFEDGDLEDDNIAGNMFALNDDDEIDLTAFDLVGVASLEDIDEDNVVYVYDNAAGDVAKIEVGTEVVTGEITKITSTGSKITVNGKTYELSAAPGADADGDWAGLGTEDEVELYLDYAGDVYELDPVSSKADQYAIILETANGTTGLNGKDAVIKLLLEDGTDKIFVADEDEIAAAFINKTTLAWKTGGAGDNDASDGTIVKYGLNSDGEIDALEAVDPDGAGALTGIDVIGGAAYSISSKGYMNGYKIASDAMIFTVDDMSLAAPSQDEDDYGVTTLDKVLDTDVTADYVLKDGVIKLIVMEADATSGDDEVYGVFVGKALVSGDPGYEITMLVDGKETVYLGNSTAYGNADAAFSLLQILEFDISGNLKNVKDATTFSADTNIVAFDKGAAPATGIDVTVTNGVATVTGTATGAETNDWAAAPNVITMAADVQVYKVNSDGDWESVSVSNVKMTNKDVTITFYDVYGDDKVADIITIE